MVNIHEKYIKRCIELAKNGLGKTYPNPLVGSVIVCDNIIIGEGWHQYAGGPHAEVKAIANVKRKELLKKATLYVNLEPCSHFGRTPPCADLIIEKQIPKVVIGTMDSNSKVCGDGIERLKEAGCEVVVGVCEIACKELNKRFFTFHLKKRPYVILKWAETSNGLMDAKRIEGQPKGPIWISNKYSRQFAHRTRAFEDAILVGTNTALNDRPGLDCRLWTGKNPIRVLIDRNLRVPTTDPIFTGEQATIVFTASLQTSAPKSNVEYVQIDFENKLLIQICKVLYERQIQSLIVEGGAKTITSFIETGLWDEAHVYIGEANFEEGLTAPILQNEPIITSSIDTDTFKLFLNASD